MNSIVLQHFEHTYMGKAQCTASGQNQTYLGAVICRYARCQTE